MKWRLRSFSASVPADSPEVRKPREKVSKDERKAMVEAFVSKYKAMNSGKFPSVSAARKEVGGSHYTIRQMIQELEYKSKMSSIGTQDSSSMGIDNNIKKNEISTGFEELSIHSGTSQDSQKSNEILGAEEFANDKVSSPNSAQVSSNTFVADIHEDDQICNENSLENKDSNYVASKPHPVVGEAQESFQSLPEKTENNMKEEKSSKDMLEFDGREPKSEQWESRELDKEPGEDRELQGKSSLWESLKSYASGFLGIWRKH